MSEPVLIGIDPGVSGAIAVLSGDGREVLAIHDMPVKQGDKGGSSKLVSIRPLMDLLRPYAGQVAVVEEQMLMGKQSAAGGMTIARNYSTILLALELLEIGVRLVRPQAWKKVAQLIKADKKASIARAESMYPAARALLTRHDRADAVLIARTSLGGVL